MTGAIVVTGAAGFIGRALVPSLTARGLRVRGVEHPARAVPMAGVENVALDLEQPGALTAAVAGAEVVIHLAGRAHILRDDASDPLARFRSANRDATLRLAEAAHVAGVRRFIFVSSIGVLGDRTAGRPFDAATVPAPTAPYAISKWEAEEGLRALGSRTGLEIVIIRPPLVHGVGAPGNFARLLRLVGSGVPLPFATVVGRRTFVAVENLCDLFTLAIDHPGAIRAPLLAGDAESLTLPELLTVLAEGMGRRSPVFPFPGIGLAGHLPLLGPTLRKLTDSLEVDISETSRLLSWRPAHSAGDALRAMARGWRARPW